GWGLVVRSTLPPIRCSTTDRGDSFAIQPAQATQAKPKPAGQTSPSARLFQGQVTKTRRWPVAPAPGCAAPRSPQRRIPQQVSEAEPAGWSMNGGIAFVAAFGQRSKQRPC